MSTWCSLTLCPLSVCRYEAKFPNPKQIDGIIGLADKGESDSGATTPIDDLVSSGQMDNVFGLCLTEQGGQMYLGDNGTHLIEHLSETSEIGWTPRRLDGATPALYAVNVLDIQVAGVSIGVDPKIINDGDAIVDSGTSDVCLPQSAWKATKQHFSDLCSNKTVCLKGICNCDTHKPLENQIFENRCVEMDEEDRAVFPTITVLFEGGLTVPHPPSSYLRNGSQFCTNSPSSYSIEISRCGPDGSGTILGDTFMRGFNVIHDRRSPQRIGFAPVGSSCP